MNYPYANGTIAAIEEKILDKNKLSKILQKDQHEIIKILVDSGYGETMTNNLEDLINQELLKTKELIESIAPEAKHSDMFFIASDNLNIKILYKMKIFKINQEDILADSGVIPLDSLKKAILEDDFINLDKSQLLLFKEINEKIQGETNPQIISAIIDNAVFQYLFLRLKKHPSVALKTYYQTFVDFANVITFIRSLNLKWTIEEFWEMFVFGGKLPQELFNSCYEQTTDNILKAFKEYYEGEITKGLKNYFDSKDLNRLESYFDQLTLNIMKEFRFDSFSIGPMIYYYLKKQAEAKNIRYIYSNPDLNASMLLDY